LILRGSRIKFIELKQYNIYTKPGLTKRFLTLCRSRTPDERFLEIADPLTNFFLEYIFFYKTSHVIKTKIIIINYINRHNNTYIFIIIFI
jgi:hypothetical protein